MSKIKKIRTSITIDPNVLNAARDVVDAPDSSYKSVAALIEAALRDKVGSKEPEAPEAVEAPVT